MDQRQQREYERLRRRLNQTETMDSDLDDTGGADHLNVGTATTAATGEVRASDDIVAGAALGAGLVTLAPAATIHAQQQTIGNDVGREESLVNGFDSVLERTIHARLATIDATVASLWTYQIPAATTVMIEAKVYARRTGGVSGTAHDSAGYIIRGTFKNVGGTTATIVGAINADYTAEDQAAWNATLDVNGQNIRLRVTGAAGNNVTWHGIIKPCQVST